MTTTFADREHIHLICILLVFEGSLSLYLRNSILGLQGTIISSAPFQVKTEEIILGGVIYKIQSLLDMQQFSDPEGAAAALGISSALWPLFGRVWPMATVLAQVMLTEPLSERRVLEVGCGLALPSIIVQSQGGDITASDYHPLTRSFLVANAKLNLLPEISFKTGNWNVSSLAPEKYDLIIGSDLLYEEVIVERLASFTDHHLDRQGRLILVDPGRGNHRAFARAMERRGFAHSWTDLKLYPEDGLRLNGFIFRFCRSGSTERRT